MDKDELKEMLIVAIIAAIVIFIFTVGTWAPKAHAQSSCYTIFVDGKPVICCRSGGVVTCF